MTPQRLAQIALKVAKECYVAVETPAGTHLELEPINFARRLVAELTKGQEPVAYYCGRNQFGSPQFRIGVLPITEGPLFAAPPICPTVPDGWISAEDELPPIYDENETRYSRAVLCWCPTWYDEPTIGRCLHYSSGDHEWRLGGSPSAAQVTHWMPLPAAPEAKP